MLAVNSARGVNAGMVASSTRTVLLHPFTPLREVARRVGLEPRALLKRLGWRKDRKLYELGAASASASILLPPGSYATHKLSDMLVPADVACAVAAERGFAAKLWIRSHHEASARAARPSPRTRRWSRCSRTSTTARRPSSTRCRATMSRASPAESRSRCARRSSVPPGSPPRRRLGGAPRFFAFVDTPGHRVFDGMRAAASDGADAALVLVAADAGVQPQTTEVVRRCVRRGQRLVLAISKADLLADSVEDAAATAGAPPRRRPPRPPRRRDCGGARRGWRDCRRRSRLPARAARRSSCCAPRGWGIEPLLERLLRELSQPSPAAMAAAAGAANVRTPPPPPLPPKLRG